MFGHDERLTCIADAAIKGPKDEELCVAYKTSMYAVVAPAYFRDDGYVLAVKKTMKSYFPMPQGDELAELQTAGLVPKPLPAYQIPIIDYAFGYLLWIVIGGMIVFSILAKWQKSRRHASLSTEQPPSTDAPELLTETDRWLAEEASKHLSPGEHVEHQAYGIDADVFEDASSAYYVVLTDQRLLFFQTPFGPAHENKGVTAFDRDSIERVQRDERHVTFVLTDGRTIDFFAEWSERKLSNQRRFLRDVPRLLGAPAPAEALAGAA